MEIIEEIKLTGKKMIILIKVCDTKKIGQKLNHGKHIQNLRQKRLKGQWIFLLIIRLIIFRL